MGGVIRTPLTRWFDLSTPILGAPMAGVAGDNGTTGLAVNAGNRLDTGTRAIDSARPGAGHPPARGADRK